MTAGALLVFVLLTTADEPLDKWQGTWKAVTLMNQGKEADPEDTRKYELTVKGNRYTLKGGSEPYRGTLTLDPSKSPATVDAIYVDEDEKEVGKVLGIYKFEGDRLTICWSDADGDRPTEFVTKPDSGQRLMVLKRD